MTAATAHFSSNTTVLTGRSLRHILRSPDTIITTAVMPVAIMVLFVYVFGGAINTGSLEYIDYMLPGILLITVASGVAYTAFRLFTDVQSGVFERFQSMPIARSSALWAHVLTSLAANLLSLALVNRRGPGDGFPHRGECGRLAGRGRHADPGYTGAHVGCSGCGPERQISGGCQRLLLSADLPALCQLSFCSDGHDARSGALVR